MGSSSWTWAASLPSSLLASSCSGPSRQDERTNNCPSDSKPRHRPRLAGIWEGGFTPGTPVSTQRKDVEKTQMTKRKRNFLFSGFPPGTPVSTFTKRSRKRDIETCHGHLNLTFLPISLLLLFR